MLKKKDPGFIYIIGKDENSPIKIGRTNSDPRKRLRELQTGSSEELVVLYKNHGLGFLEIYMHDLMERNFERRNEWFYGEGVFQEAKVIIEKGILWAHGLLCVDVQERYERFLLDCCLNGYGDLWKEFLELFFICFHASFGREKDDIVDERICDIKAIARKLGERHSREAINFAIWFLYDFGIKEDVIEYVEDIFLETLELPNDHDLSLFFGGKYIHGIRQD